MYKIEQKYIDMGSSIRKQYLETQEKLEALALKVNDLITPIESEIENAKVIEEKLENAEYKSKEAFQAEFNPIMISIEKYFQQLTDVYNPLNEKMDELKREEENLYNSVKALYPTMTDDEIIKEFSERITT